MYIHKRTQTYTHTNTYKIIDVIIYTSSIIYTIHTYTHTYLRSYAHTYIHSLIHRYIYIQCTVAPKDESHPDLDPNCIIAPKFEPRQEPRRWSKKSRHTKLCSRKTGHGSRKSGRTKTLLRKSGHGRQKTDPNGIIAPIV